MPIMKYVKLVSIICACLVSLHGCATIDDTAPLSKSYKPNEGKAYIYGRFDKSAKKGMDCISCNLALVINSTDRTEEYLVEFERNSKVRVIEVDPDTYVIWGLYGGEDMYMPCPCGPDFNNRVFEVGVPVHISESAYQKGILSRSFANPQTDPWPFSIRFRVEPNHLYYIGDLWYDWRGYAPYHAAWFMEEIADRYDDATQELERKYPHLGKLPRQRVSARTNN